MRIRRTDNEDAEDTEELLATAITEDLTVWLHDWLGDSKDNPIGLNVKSEIYNIIRTRQEKGIEI